MTAKRDLALIALVALIVVVAMVCATILVCVAHADPVAGYGALTAAVGIAGVALGRISGANAAGPAEPVA